jgi:hypothetical protein
MSRFGRNKLPPARSHFDPYWTSVGFMRRAPGKITPNGIP